MMSSLNVVFASFLGLGVFALAFPLEDSQLSPRGQISECRPGTWFYRCANGYEGCFTYEPCSLPPKNRPSPVTASYVATTTSTTTTATTATTQATSAAASCTGTTRIYQPTLYNLYPTQPELSRTPVSAIQVSTLPNEAEIQQAIAFSGIPATAKTCQFGWSQGDRAERTFIVTTNGLTSVTPLSGFPAQGQPVSAASIKAFETATDKFNMDFTSWDTDQETARPHFGSTFPCAERMWFKSEISDIGTGIGKVFMEQDLREGWFIQYTC